MKVGNNVHSMDEKCMKCGFPYGMHGAYGAECRNSAVTDRASFLYTSFTPFKEIRSNSLPVAVLALSDQIVKWSERTKFSYGQICEIDNFLVEICDATRVVTFPDGYAEEMRLLKNGQVLVIAHRNGFADSSI